MVGSPTKLAAIDGLASPAQAPRTLYFSNENVRIFQHLRLTSFPGRHAHERGGTVVADMAGNLGVQNIGGTGSSKDRFFPDLLVKNPLKFSPVGTFHTHPYDARNGWANGVSFSGLDVAHLLNNRLTISVVQSGPRLFVYLRTEKSPTTVDPYSLYNAQNEALWSLTDKGRSAQQASRIVAQQAAAMYNLAYYQGADGVVTRVHPA